MGFGGFNIDFPGFWSILGEFWGAMLEPFGSPKRRKIGKNRYFYHFSGFGGFKIDFSGFWSILGEFWGTHVGPILKPKTDENREKSIFLQFLQALPGLRALGMIFV